MPPLSNLSLGHNQGQAAHDAAEVSYHTNQQAHYGTNHGGVHGQHAAPPPPTYPPQQSARLPTRQAVQSPAEVSIQSWAGEAVQQPQPVQPSANPAGGVWNPTLGIKFGAPSLGPGGQGQQGGTWKPGSGIKFG